MGNALSLYPWLTESWQRFALARKANKVPHAILISGRRGLGKKQLAEQMIASLLCQQPDEAVACGQCHSCQLLTAGTHPDHVVVSPEEAGKQIKIDQIRELKDRQTLSAKVAKWKTVIITAADNLNINAFNSLLKLLEEPQQNTVLILLSENSHQLPITIRSRCQVMAIDTPRQAIALEWLTQQLPMLSDDDKVKLLTMNLGSPLAALDYYQGEQQIDIQSIDNDLEKLINGQANPIQLAAQWQQYELSMLFHYLQNQTQNKLKNQLVANAAHNTSEISHLWAVSDCILNTIKLISSSNNLNKTLLIEDFMVSISELNRNPLRENR